MSLEQLYQALEHHVVHFGRKIWPPDPLVAWSDEAQYIAKEIHEKSANLQQKLEESKSLRKKVFKDEVQATILKSQIESCVFTGDQFTAWKNALELDKGREALQLSRKRLTTLENQCRRLEKSLEHLKNRLKLLQIKSEELSRSANSW